MPHTCMLLYELTSQFSLLAPIQATAHSILATITTKKLSARISGASLFGFECKMGALGVSHVGTSILGHNKSVLGARTLLQSGSKKVINVRRGGAQWRASLSSSGSGSSAVASEKKDVEEQELVQLGQSNVMVSKIGIGAWSWGDRLFWNDSWDDKKIKDSRDAFNAGMDAGLNFFDTAEVYGSPQWAGGDDSESLLGRAIRDRERKGGSGRAVVATKFAALPWRLSRRSVVVALRDSLSRLGLSSIDLYQLHWPGLWGNEGFIDGLGDAVEQGLVKAVGVSNYNEKRLRATHEQLARRGIPLASNQVHYSLIYRLPEENNVKNTCDELGVSLIAYSPLGQGILSGKYSAANPPSGPRGRTYDSAFLTRAAPLLSRMREIGEGHGKSSTQVALNWLLLQGNVVPIPGAKPAAQANEFAGALGWSLTTDEERELHTLSKRVQPVRGFPAEGF